MLLITNNLHFIAMTLYRIPDTVIYIFVCIYLSDVLTAVAAHYVTDIISVLVQL